MKSRHSWTNSKIEDHIEGLAPVKVVKRIWHSYQVGSEDLDDMRRKLTFHTSTISLFLDSLSSAALGRIECKVDQILAKLMMANPRQSTASVSSIHSSASLIQNLSKMSGTISEWNCERLEFPRGISKSIRIGSMPTPKDSFSMGFLNLKW
jgi:hypothetical protein